MGLETGTTIADLVSSNPGGGDDRSTADDHLRLIKSILKSQFPNLNAVTNMTPAELNLLVGLVTTTAKLNALNGLTSSKAVATDSSGLLQTLITTATELDYVAGVTSSVQNQLNVHTTNIAALGALTSATTTVEGIIELATDAEIAALTDLVRAITPGRLASAWSTAVTTRSAPDGAVFQRGGPVSVPALSSVVVTISAMPSINYTPIAGCEGLVPGISPFSTKVIDTTSFRISNGNTGAVDAHWIALGLV